METLPITVDAALAGLSVWAAYLCSPIGRRLLN